MHHLSSWKGQTWNRNLVRLLYDQTPSDTILNQAFSLYTGVDQIVWILSPDGNYTAKAGFKILSMHLNYPHHDDFWKFMWFISLPQKYLLFLWKLLHDAIPTGDVLQHHHLNNRSMCSFGCDRSETLLHLFCSCSLTRAIWFHSLGIRVDFSSFPEFKTWLKSTLLALHSDARPETISKIIILLNFLWMKRNNALHHGKKLDILKTVAEIKAEAEFIDLLSNLQSKRTQPRAINNLREEDVSFHTEWTIIIQNTHRSTFKEIDIWICLQNQPIQKFSFVKASRNDHSFHFKSIRLTLSWILNMSFFDYQHSDLALWIVNKGPDLSTILTKCAGDTVIRDIQLQMKEFKSLTINYCSTLSTSFLFFLKSCTQNKLIV